MCHRIILFEKKTEFVYLSLAKMCEITLNFFSVFFEFPLKRQELFTQFLLDDINFFILECQTQQGENCIFPFKFKGKKYGKCTSDYLKKGQWCATGVHRNGTMMKSRWGHCNLG